VAAPATGAWAGKEYFHARWNGTEWVFSGAAEGSLYWIADENVLLVPDGTGYAQIYPQTSATTSAGTSALTVVASGTFTVAIPGGFVPVTSYTITSQTCVGGTVSVLGTNQVKFTFAVTRPAVDYAYIGGVKMTGINNLTTTEFQLAGIEPAGLDTAQNVYRFTVVKVGE
jgi:hypothetical protein